MISLTSQAPTSPPTRVKKLRGYYLLEEHLRPNPAHWGNGCAQLWVMPLRW